MGLKMAFLTSCGWGPTTRDFIGHFESRKIIRTLWLARIKVYPPNRSKTVRATRAQKPVGKCLVVILFIYTWKAIETKNDHIINDIENSIPKLSLEISFWAKDSHIGIRVLKSRENAKIDLYFIWDTIWPYCVQNDILRSVCEVASVKTEVVLFRSIPFQQMNLFGLCSLQD